MVDILRHPAPSQGTLELLTRNTQEEHPERFLEIAICANRSDLLEKMDGLVSVTGRHIQLAEEQAPTLVPMLEDMMKRDTSPAFV